MSERFKVTKFEEPSGKTYKNYGATSAETDAEAKGKLLPDSAFPDGARVVGGVPTTIEQYAYSAALLRSGDFINFQQLCGGVIVNNRAVITAAHCVVGDAPARWRIRVGSTYASSGGVVHSVNSIFVHLSFMPRTYDADIAIIRPNVYFSFNNYVRPAVLADSSFSLPDNSVVWATGWGATSYQGPRSEVLRHTQVWVVNPDVCQLRYLEVRRMITSNMLCTGWLDGGSRDQCTGDDGSPIVANTSAGAVVVGLRSWGHQCAHPRYPGIATRVSKFFAWIAAYA